MPNEPDESYEKTITEIGRELLKYLQTRVEDLGINQASYRQARMELLKRLEGEGKRRFNWGFEAVFTQEVHTLEELGLISVKYGSGAIMAGRSSPNQIYNFALTKDGRDTARIISERDDRVRSETAKLDKATDVISPEIVAEDVPDEDEDDLDDTDQSPVQEAPKKPEDE
ncbi:MAG: hypothetical protein L3J82_06235 [Planctomycetes bacterium]|nr:hypothetical protein [Planctomycetota bacterium]